VAIYYPPPPPFMGGAQPHVPRELPPSITAVEVDNPPSTLGGPISLPASVIAANWPEWSAVAWPYAFIRSAQPYGQRQLSPGIPGQDVDKPPISQLGGPYALKAEAVAIAQPDPWTYSFFGGRAPFEPKKLSPGIPGQDVDNPPFTYGGPLALKLQGVMVNQPDWSLAAWPYVFMGNRQPYIGQLLAPAITAVQVNTPPFTQFERTAAAAAIRAAWNPPPPDWQMQLYATRYKPQRIAPTAHGYVIL
jgi:hypothetical protein